MKHFTKCLKFLLLTLSIVGGVGTAWAEEEPFYTLVPTSGTNNAYASACDVLIDGITWNVTGNSTTDPWRIGGKSLTNVNRTVYSKTGMSAAVSKVDLVVGNASSITVNSLTLVVAGDDSYTSVIDEVSATFEANSTITFEPSTDKEWTSGAYYKFVFNVTVSGTSNKFVEFSKAKFYKQEGGDTPSAVLTSIALSGSYSTTFTEGDEFSMAGMIVTATYDDASTKDVTSKATFTGYEMDNPGEQTVAVSYTEGEVTKEAKYTITVNALPAHTVTWSVNGETTADTYKEGAAITFPEDPEAISGKSFYGWTTAALNDVTDEAPETVSSATMGTEDITYYAVFATVTKGDETTVTDVLDRETTGVTGTSYNEWSGKTATSAAVYAGNSAGSNESIQLRSNNSNSGIISTATGGKIKKVVVEWNKATEANRTLDIYGSNTAYTAASELYNTQKQGTKLGSIVKEKAANSSETDELTIDGDYAFIGFRSRSGAMYLSSVSITWSNGTPDSYSGFCTTVVAETREEAGLSFSEEAQQAGLTSDYEGQLLTNPNSLSVTWTSSNEDVATVDENGTVSLKAVGETTITATFAGNDDYMPGQASYTLTVWAEATILVEDSEVAYGQTFTVDADLIEGGAITVTSSNDNVATVDGLVVTPVAVGTVTITVATAETETYKAGSESFTLTVTAPAGLTTAKPADSVVGSMDFTGNDAWKLPTTGTTTEKTYTDGTYSVTLAGTGTHNYNTGYLFLKSGGTLTFQTFDKAVTKIEVVGRDGASSKTIENIYVGETVVSTATTGSIETNTFEIKSEYQAAGNVYTLHVSSANAQITGINIYFAASGAGSETVTFNASGYATFCSEYPLDFTDTKDVNAYAVTAINGTEVTFTKVSGCVKGGTGLFLVGEASSTVAIPSADSKNALSDNLLVGTLAPTYVTTTEGDYTNFGLKGDSFVKINDGTVKNGKAYLPVLTSAISSGGESKLRFVFTDEATGIATVAEEQADAEAPIYNLSGQRVSAAYKGIVIKKGKKYLNK